MKKTNPNNTHILSTLLLLFKHGNLKLESRDGRRKRGYFILLASQTGCRPPVQTFKVTSRIELTQFPNRIDDEWGFGVG